MFNLDSKQNHLKHWQYLDSIRKKSYLTSFLMQFSDSKKHFQLRKYVVFFCNSSNGTTCTIHYFYFVMISRRGRFDPALKLLGKTLFGACHSPIDNVNRYVIKSLYDVELTPVYWAFSSKLFSFPNTENDTFSSFACHFQTV